jgi:hypothetical protein
LFVGALFAVETKIPVFQTFKMVFCDRLANFDGSYFPIHNADTVIHLQIPDRIAIANKDVFVALVVRLVGVIECHINNVVGVFLPCAFMSGVFVEKAKIISAVHFVIHIP